MEFVLRTHFVTFNEHDIKEKRRRLNYLRKIYMYIQLFNSSYLYFIAIDFLFIGRGVAVYYKRKKKKKEEKEENRRITTVASNITTFLVHKHLAKIRIQISKGAYLPPASGLCIFWIIFVLGTGSSLENYIAFAYWRGVIGVSFVLSNGD